MRTIWRLTLLLWVVFALGCNSKKDSAETGSLRPSDERVEHNGDGNSTSSGTGQNADPGQPPSVVTTRDQTPPIPGTASPRNTGEIEKRLRNAKFRQIKPMSSRSRSVRLYFPDGGSAIFKPMLVGDSSARLEVAFYRLAAVLNVQTVPVSVMRPIYPDRFENALMLKDTDEARAFLDALERDARGRVWGAMIEWLEGLKPVGAEDDRGRLDVRVVFGNDARRNLWASLSDAIVLDYLLGNWDRFSGGNLFRMENGDALALIDHNEAFYRLNARQKQLLDDSLRAVRCFSPALVLRLRELTPEIVDSALKTTDWDGVLLRQVEIGNIFKRKDTLLKFIDRRIAAANGTDEWKCD